VPVYDNRAMPMLKELRSASEAEGAAINALLSYMQNGGRDNNRLLELTNEMTSSHDKKMQIYQEMQQFRLDV
jgi:hypothetical protein